MGNATEEELKELAYQDYLLRQFDNDDRSFIINESYPQLQDKLVELVKRKHQAHPAPNSTVLDINFKIADNTEQPPQNYFEQRNNSRDPNS